MMYPINYNPADPPGHPRLPVKEAIMSGVRRTGDHFMFWLAYWPCDWDYGEGAPDPVQCPTWTNGECRCMVEPL